jgi:hypothetical protein
MKGAIAPAGRRQSSLASEENPDRGRNSPADDERRRKDRAGSTQFLRADNHAVRLTSSRLPLRQISSAATHLADDQATSPFYTAQPVRP